MFWHAVVHTEAAPEAPRSARASVDSAMKMRSAASPSLDVNARLTVGLSQARTVCHQ